MYRLSTKAAVISFGQLSTTLSHLAVAVILSYSLSKSDYGSYRQVWLLYRTLIPILTLGLPISINYFFPKLESSGQKIQNLQTYLLLAVLGLLLSSILFFCAPLFSAWFNNQRLTEFLRIFSLIPLLTFPTLYYQNLFVCLDKTVLVVKISLFMALGYFGSCIIPILLGYSIKEIFIIFSVFSFLQLLIVSYFMFRPFEKLKIEWKNTFFFEQLKYSFPIGLTLTVGILSKQLDKLVISSYFSPDQFATYINGAFELPLIGILTGSITAVLMPEFVKLVHTKDINELIRIWHSAIRKVALIIFPVMFFLLIFAPEFLTLLFSQKYAASSSIFRIYLLALPHRITNYGMILLSLGLSSLVLRYSIYMLTFNLGLNFALIHLLGFSGPAIATLIVVNFINFAQLNIISKKLSIPFRDIFPWLALGKILIVSSGTAGIIYIAKLLVPFQNNILLLFSAGILFCIIFFIIGFSLKFLNKNDLQIPIKILNDIWRKKV